MEISIVNIVDKLQAAGHSLEYENLDDIISIDTRITACCPDGHRRTTPAGNVNVECEMCNQLASLRLGDSGINPVTDHYVVGQPTLDFVCSLGHVFAVIKGRTYTNCKSCHLLKMARAELGDSLVMDTMCKYTYENSRLRFHCNSDRHNPSCSNAECKNKNNWSKCSNIIPCDQDFYATAWQLKETKYIYSCGHNHMWTKLYQVIACIRILEIIFNARFDDTADDVIFSGYNEELRIAFIHGLDRTPMNKLDEAVKWCSKNHVNFIHIPQNVVESSSIAVLIVERLVELELIEGKSSTIINNTRQIMREQNANNKLFVDRCVE